MYVYVCVCVIGHCNYSCVFSRSASCTNELVIGSSLTSLGFVRAEVHVVSTSLPLPLFSPSLSVSLFLFRTVWLFAAVAQSNAASEFTGAIKNPAQLHVCSVQIRSRSRSQSRIRQRKSKSKFSACCQFSLVFSSRHSIAGGVRRRSWAQQKKTSRRDLRGEKRRTRIRLWSK